MDWVDGDTLETFIAANLDKPSIMSWLVEQFKLLCERLRKAQIAHGDLQHGNLIVNKRGLRVIDYDGAYVPALNGMPSGELGHHNYQHPKRTSSDFGPYLDNFSAWVIHVSLQATAGIAHGDIEFGNLIFDRHQNELKIVDYDNMFVPALTRMGSMELGHPGFQSPRRTSGDYGPFVDNFSGWLVHYMLKNLAINAQLHELLEACLQEERQGSTAHNMLRKLENDRESEIKQLGRMLRLLLERPLHMIPDVHPDETLEHLIANQSKEVTSTSGLLKRKPRTW